jgi:NADH:ubiquinone oxidoreductase subunit D
MDYLKIAEQANKCESLRSKINSHYQFLGAHRDLTEDTQKMIQKFISIMEEDLIRMESKLTKMIN